MSTIDPYMDAAERLDRAEFPDAAPDTIMWVRNMATGHADPDAPTLWPHDRTMMRAAEAWVTTMWPGIEAAVRASS